MMAQMYDFTCKGVFALPEYGIKTGWQSNGTYAEGPFQLGARTKLEFWEYLKEDPQRMKLFNSGMRSQATIGNGSLSGAYPFGEELNAVQVEDDEVLIVDVGGGRGQSLEAIRHDYPHLKGRLILQDLPDVIEDAKTKGLPSFIEPHVGSFFEPQAIKGSPHEISDSRRIIC
jgi:O-methyltransferase domain